MISVEGGLNPQSPQLLNSLGDYKDQATTRLVRSQTPSGPLLQELGQAAVALPEDVRPIFGDGKVARYTASLITSNNHPLGDSLGFFFLPGILGTAPSTAHIAGQFYREASDRMEKPVIFSSSLSSSIGVDMRDQPFLGTTKRAAFQAGLMADILAENPASEVWLMGHSDGALSALHALPILEQILENRGSQTRVAGLVLTQSAGLYDQNILTFPLRYFGMPLMKEAISHLFPTQKEIVDTRNRLAGEHDLDTRVALFEELRRMQLRYTDSRPEGSVLKDEVNKLLMGADTRGRQEGQRENLQMVRSYLEWMRAAPESISRLVDVSVAIQWGERDPNFPPQKAGNVVNKETFPNSPAVMTATLLNWPHWGPAINAEQYAQMTVTIIQKLTAPSKPEAHIYL